MFIHLYHLPVVYSSDQYSRIRAAKAARIRDGAILGTARGRYDPRRILTGNRKPQTASCKP